MRPRTKQIRFLCHIGNASHSFLIIGLGCVDKREFRRILGRGRKRLFHFHTASAPVRMYTDYGRSRRCLISFRNASNILTWVRHYAIWCRFDASHSSEGLAIRHGISKNENRTPSSIVGGQ